MPELTFSISGVEAPPHAATPLLLLKIRICCGEPHLQIQNILLQCQIQIEPVRRRYFPDEQEKLLDLFGSPSRWSQTVRALLWANSIVVVPGFQGETLADVPLPCTFDFNIAATKYLYSLEDGDVPFSVLFSGTVFYANQDGRLQLARIPWSSEANYRLPVRAWKEMMDNHYPNSAWLCLQRDAFDQIYRYKVERGIPTWEQAIESLLAAAEESDVRKAGA